MPSFFRVMMIVGVAALVPVVVVLWRQNPPPSTVATTPPADPPPVSTKAVGTSALSHGGPASAPTMSARLAGEQSDPQPGQTAWLDQDDTSRFQSSASGLRAGTPVEVVITKREARQLPDWRVDDRYEVRFPDGTTAWVKKLALRTSEPRNERSTKER